MGSGGQSFGNTYTKNVNGTKRDVNYGDEYKTVFTSGNIKFVEPNSDLVPSVTAPMQTMTKGRVYATIDTESGEVKHITYYDTKGKRVKQVDLYPPHKGMDEHTHHGYYHKENDGPKGATALTPEEKKMVERVKREWYNHKHRKH